MRSMRFKESTNPCTAFFREFLNAIFRTKTSTHEYTKLDKVLDMFDVTMLGVGTTIGMGSYIFIGYYAKEIGPAVVISHLLAALVSFMNALCYAEFVSREPGSGGAYSQAYYLLGEFLAAIIGWLLAGENVFGSALSARGLSEVIDMCAGNRISDYLKSYVTFSNPFLADYPDVPAVLIELIILTIVSFGLKEVTFLNNFIVAINVSVLILIVLVSGSNIEFSNWTLPPKEGCGNGGFMPYGVSSIWNGVNKVFYAYIGFDAAGHAGSEVTDPERTIPTSLLLSVMVVTVLYLFQTFTHTLLWPYCDQDISAPIQHTMSGIGMEIMKWITTVGCPIGLIGKGSKYRITLNLVTKQKLTHKYMY
ncbi:hypothetical protein A483_HHAL011525 [Halyomorpha halys]|nr:hypothetical protein A483_HHAL011525 [Halyomorpha halys]